MLSVSADGKVVLRPDDHGELRVDNDNGEPLKNLPMRYLFGHDCEEAPTEHHWRRS